MQTKKVTVRETAGAFGISKSTVHSDITEKLIHIDKELFDSIRELLIYNFSVRHIRGGESTKKKYLAIK